MRIVTSALVAVALAGQASYPPPFPRPGATKLFENDRVVVWDVTWPNGAPAPMHRHVYDVTGVYYQVGKRMITGEDGVTRPTVTEFGAVTYRPKGTTHQEVGASDPPARAVLIELKSDGPTGLVDTRTDLPPAFPRPGVKKVLDNEKVTVWDYTWTIGQSIPMHRHTHDAVVVWLGNGTLRSTSPTDPPGTVVAEIGKIRWATRGTVHTEEAVTGAPRAMVFELK